MLLRQSLRFLDPLRRNRSGDSSRVRVAIALIRHLAKNKNTEHITISLARKITTPVSDKVTDHQIVGLLQYLAGDGVQLLEVCFEIIEDEIPPRVLNVDEVQGALTSNIHPDTGEVDVDIKKKIFLFYKPTEKAFSILEPQLSHKE
jgi:hypothetical protein